jgi:tRNA(Ile2) C34 agmatinyltransferase TiaS
MTEENAKAAPPPAPSAEEALLYCPTCSQRLQERGCKLRCPRCGYYLSCSDYV